MKVGSIRVLKLANNPRAFSLNLSMHRAAFLAGSVVFALLNNPAATADSVWEDVPQKNMAPKTGYPMNSNPSNATNSSPTNSGPTSVFEPVEPGRSLYKGFTSPAPMPPQTEIPANASQASPASFNAAPYNSMSPNAFPPNTYSPGRYAQSAYSPNSYPRSSFPPNSYSSNSYSGNGFPNVGMPGNPPSGNGFRGDGPWNASPWNASPGNGFSQNIPSGNGGYSQNWAPASATLNDPRRLRLSRPDSQGMSAGAIPSVGNMPSAVAGPPPEQQSFGDWMNLDAARRYVVELINKDRAAMKLSPVVLDMVASTAGQRHTDEMVTYGYLSHWGMDGKKPPERYTEGGGKDFDAENVWLWGMEVRGQLSPDPDARFSREDLEKAESAFINEKPPMDGHRKNILQPLHNGVGICISRATKGDHSRIALSQEFINHYGTYADMPYQVGLNDSFTDAGKLAAGATFYNITLYREDEPKSMSIGQLKETSSYGLPPPLKSLWAPPFNSDVPVQVRRSPDGDEYSVQLVPSQSMGGTGLYTIAVWAKFRKDAEPVMVSARTVLVTNRK